MRLDEYPFVCLRIACFRCRRQGVYRTARLAERLGAACPLETVRERLAWTVLAQQRNYEARVTKEAA